MMTMKLKILTCDVIGMGRDVDDPVCGLGKIYSRLPVEEREQHAVRQLCFFNPISSALYLDSLVDNSSKLILQTLVDHQPPFLYPPQDSNFSISNFQWLISCVSKLLGIEIRYDMEPFYIRILQARSNTYEPLVQFLKNPNQQITSKIAELILNLACDSSTLFSCMRVQFNPVITQLTANSIANKLGYDAIRAFGTTIFDISMFKFDEMSDSAKLFGIPNVYTEPQFTQTLQKKVFSQTPFPKTTFFGGFSKLASLFNTAASQEKHFLDVAILGGVNALTTGNFESLNEYLSLLPELKTWAIVAAIQQKGDDDAWLGNAVKIVQNLPNDKSGELIHRIRNDIDYAQQIQMYTGRHIPIEELAQKSIPLLLSIVLANFDGDPFDKMYNSPMFCVSDLDRINDYNFVCAYFALGSLLRILVNQTEETGNMFHTIEESIRAISDPNLKEAVVADAFSLLFVKSNDNFLCSLETAETLLPILIGLSDDAELANNLGRAHRRILPARVLNGNGNLSAALSGPVATMVAAMESGDWEIAASVAAESPFLLKVMTVFKAVGAFRRADKNVMIPIDFFKGDFVGRDEGGVIPELVSIVEGRDHSISKEEILNQIAAEVGFAFDRQIDALEYISDFSPKAELSRIARMRLEIPLDVVGATEFVQELAAKLVRMTAVEWNSSESKDLERCNLLHTFFEYLDRLIPVLLKDGSVVGDVIKTPPRRLVPDLLLKGDITAAESVAQIMHLDISEAALLYAPGSAATAKVLSDCPAARIADAIVNGRDMPLDAGRVINEYVSADGRKKQLMRQRFGLSAASEREDSDDCRQEGRSQSSLVNELRQAVFGSLDPEAITELSYRIDPEDFTKVVKESIQSVDVVVLAKALKESACEETLYNRVQLLADAAEAGSQPFPFKACLAGLLKQRKYELAKRFTAEFRYDFNAVSVLREEALSLLREEKDITELLEVSPGQRSEVISSLPPRFHDMVDQPVKAFFAAIPPSWQIAADPVQTVRGNIDKEEFGDIMARFPTIDIDKDLLAVLNGKLSHTDIPHQYRIQKISEFVQTHARSFRNPGELQKLVVKTIIGFVSDIKVEGATMEQMALTLLVRICCTLFECETAFMRVNMQLDPLRDIIKYVSPIRSFVSCGYSARFDKIYSFSQPLSKECGKNLMELCIEFDNLSLAMEIANVWGLEIHDVRERIDGYARKALQLGMFDDGIKISVDRRKLISQHTNEMVQKAIAEFRLTPVIDRSLIREMLALELPANVEYFVDEFIFQDMIKESPVFAALPQFQAKDAHKNREIPLRQTLTFDTRRRMVSPELARSSESIFRSIKHAERSLEIVPSVIAGGADGSGSSMPEIIPHFFFRLVGIVNSVFPTEQPLSGVMDKLAEYLTERAPLSQRLSFLIQSRSYKQAIRIVEEAQRGQTRWDLFFAALFQTSLQTQGGVNNLLGAIKESDPDLKVFGQLLLKLLKTAHKIGASRLEFDLAMYLGMPERAQETAKTLFAKAESTRECISYLDMISRCITLTETDTNRRFIEGVRIQREFCELLLKKGIQDCRSMNIFGESTAKLSVITFLFRELHFKLGMQALEFTRVPIKEVADHIAGILPNEPEQSAVAFTMEFERNVPGELFRQIMLIIVLRLCFDIYPTEEKRALTIARKIIDTRFRALLLVQLGDIEGAFATAKAANDVEILPTIGNTAHIMGKASVVDDVQKILTRK